MGKEIAMQVQENQRVPNRINPRQNTPRHILIKLTKIKHKEQILKDQLLSLWEFPCVICCFSLAGFNICSLGLIFVNLINMRLGVFCLGFILSGTLWLSWTWVAISFPILGKFSMIISSIFSWPFFLSSSGTPMI